MIIAEISGNHCGQLGHAFELIKTAKECGADAVKIQTFEPSELTLNCKKDHFKINDPNSPWNGRYLYDIYCESYTPKGWHKPLFDYAKEVGIKLFSTPFSRNDVDFLEQFDPPFYKIASMEAADISFVRYVISKKRPVIISTGALSLQAVKTIKHNLDCNMVFGCFMHCISKYDNLTPDNMLLGNIKLYKAMADVHAVGLSDHSKGTEAAEIATYLGATVIEKHLAIRDGAIDASFSLRPEEFKKLVERVNRAHEIMKSGESKLTNLARSCFIVQDINKGEIFTEENIRVIRPGFGLMPSSLSNILGKVAPRDLERGEPFTKELLFESTYKRESSDD